VIGVQFFSDDFVRFPIFPVFKHSRFDDPRILLAKLFHELHCGVPGVVTSNEATHESED
jgi:hypothetical protein